MPIFTTSNPFPKQIVNVGLTPQTTTNSNDTIRITGASAALSVSNIAYFPIQSAASQGLVAALALTADVDIVLTGAHWGQGTLGDLTNAILRVYAINDNGTLKFGVGYIGGRVFVADTSTSTTATSVTEPEYLLVNSALSAGTWPCIEIGAFLASFDDTGGAAEDLWAIASGVNFIAVGDGFKGMWQSFNTTITGFSVLPSFASLKWKQDGLTAIVHGVKSSQGTSDSTSFTVQLPVKAKDLVTASVVGPRDNSTDLTSLGTALTAAGSRTLTLYRNNANGPWTNTGGKSASFFAVFEISL